jgi:hypothetical protein
LFACLFLIECSGKKEVMLGPDGKPENWNIVNNKAADPNLDEKQLEQLKAQAQQNMEDAATAAQAAMARIANLTAKHDQIIAPLSPSPIDPDTGAMKSSRSDAAGNGATPASARGKLSLNNDPASPSPASPSAAATVASPVASP